MSLLLQNWTTNENQIAARIDLEYFPRLRHFAQRVLGALPGAGTEADDVVQSALMSLCLYMRRQTTTADKDRHDVWRLLCHLAACKAARRRQRQTRGLPGGRVVPMSDLSSPDDAQRLELLLQDVSADDLDLTLQEAIQSLDPSLQPVALLVLEGRSQSEISERLGCSRRTVIRKLDLAKQLLRLSLEEK